MTRTSLIRSLIPELREEYHRLLPGKESLIRVLNEAEVPEHVYNSNAIENSTLTLEETEKILLKVELDRFVSERELFEAKNLARVMEYIEHRAKERELSLSLMTDLHKMLIGNINDDIAGRFRAKGEYVRVGTHVAPAPERVEPLLTEALAAYHGSSSDMVERLARFHLAFEFVHPFCDGNGRIGRALNNYALIREGYVHINIAFADRVHYYDAFKEYQEGQRTGVMEEIVGRALAMSFHKRLSYLWGAEVVPLADYAKRHTLSHSNLINKAKRQTIPAFLEKGVWKIGVDFAYEK